MAAQESDGYKVMPGVVDRLRQLVDDGHLVGLITGNVEAAAHIKLARGGRAGNLRLCRARTH